jgi:acyl-CoA thioester hydrolase
MPGGGRFFHRLRVRYSEIDGQMMVFNSVYLNYLDAAITEYFRAIGIDYPKMLAAGEFDFALARATVDFRGPAFFDDLLDVYVRVVRLGNKSFTVRFQILRAGTEELLTEAENVYVCYDARTRCTYSIPPAVRDAILRFEGADMAGLGAIAHGSDPMLRDSSTPGGRQEG